MVATQDREGDQQPSFYGKRCSDSVVGDESIVTSTDAAAIIAHTTSVVKWFSDYRLQGIKTLKPDKAVVMRQLVICACQCTSLN